MSIEVLNNVDLVFIAEEYLNRVSRSRLNLIARGARSKAELINFYLRSGDEPNTHMRTLENVAERAKLVLERIPTLAMYDKRVPWRFWVFHGTNVENGMPHTHGNVICLNRRNLMGSFPNLLRTVVHERIHVLQRMFPGFWHAQYLKFGWTPVTLNGFPSHWRLNPDLPDLYYEYKGDFGVMTTQGQDLGDGHMEWI